MRYSEFIKDISHLKELLQEEDPEVVVLDELGPLGIDVIRTTDGLLDAIAIGIKIY